MLKPNLKSFSPLLRASGKVGLIGSDLLIALPQLSCTSESLLTLRYAKECSSCKFNLINIVVGILRLLLILPRISLNKQRGLDYSKVLCISHAVVNNTKADDFYYGATNVMKHYLRRDVDLIYILHDKSGHTSNRFYLNSNISPVDYLKLISVHIQGLTTAIFMMVRMNSSPMRKYLAYSLIRGDGLETSLRAAGVRKLIIKAPIDIKLRSMLTIEGHAWEKMIIKIMRESGRFSRIYGYAHSALRKSTTWLKYRCNKLYTPDTIFFPNQIYLDYFENINEKNYIETLLYPSQKPKLINHIGGESNKRSILMLPEGLVDEELLFIKLAVELKEIMPYVKVAIKWHPNYFSRNLESLNDSICEYNPEVVYSDVIYRGSYAVMDFLDTNVGLFFLSNENAPDTNPIFMIPDRFRPISNAADLRNLFTNDGALNGL